MYNAHTQEEIIKSDKIHENRTFGEHLAATRGARRTKRSHNKRKAQNGSLMGLRERKGAPWGFTKDNYAKK